MNDLFLLRSFDPPIEREDVMEMARTGSTCFRLHGVDWQVSLLKSDGTRMFCHFKGRDAESVRIALRQLDTDMRFLWAGTVHDRSGLTKKELDQANVLVERKFETPADLEAIQAREDAGSWCLETYNVSFVRTFFSRDRLNMMCLYNAPDAESVRQAQHMAKMPVSQVWSFRAFGPNDLETS